MQPILEQIFTLRAFLGKEDMLPLDSVKGGAHRGADWLLFDPASGTAHLDIRFQAHSSCGDMVYGHHPGIIKMDPEVERFLHWSSEANTTQSQDHYFFTKPVFEVSSENLKWMEQNVFVSHGHFHVPGDGSQALKYEVYKVVSG